MAVTVAVDLAGVVLAAVVLVGTGVGDGAGLEPIAEVLLVLVNMMDALISAPIRAAGTDMTNGTAAAAGSALAAIALPGRSE